jgi:hypothetical protein
VSRLVLIGLAALVIGRLFAMQGLEAAFAGLLGVALCVSMIELNDFWAEHLLPFGFWASKARDFEQAGRSAGAVALIGWILLLLLAGAVLLAPAPVAGALA